MAGKSGTSERRCRLWIGGAVALALLAACEPLGRPTGKTADAAIAASPLDAQEATTRIVEHDVEAPEIFHRKAPGLWDGRPSLGGVWVAHPDVKDPERVIIRNEANGKFVIGALFRRERDMPGPAFQISSDAAAALGVLPGKPVPLSVTALRRKKVALPEKGDKTGPATPLARAEAAIADAEGSGTRRDGRPPARPPLSEAKGKANPPKPPAPARSGTAARQGATRTGAGTTTGKLPGPATPLPARSADLARPYVQVGIFSIEANAKRTARLLEAEGIVPLVKAQESRGRRFWRVLVGPATNGRELKILLGKVRKAGFLDAYPVSR